MVQNNIDVGPQHLKNIADLPAFKDFYLDCPKTRKTPVMGPCFKQ